MMSHNDTVKQSFRNQAEKFAAYHMSKLAKKTPVCRAEKCSMQLGQKTIKDERVFTL